MRSIATDVAIIGAGTAGLSARREAARAGKRTLLIEEGPHGTTCARVGCMPSKLLVAAAEIAHDVARAHRFGIEGVDRMRINGSAVLERVRRERDRFVGSVLDSVNSLPADERIDGHAAFVAPSTLEVDGETRVEARSVVIATGSTPWIPAQLEELQDDVLISDDIFDLHDLPRSIAVCGTGIVALELGQALARLGVETTFVSPFAEVGPLTDPELKKAARTVLGAELDLQLEVDYRVARSGPGRFRLEWESEAGRAAEVVVERILVAAGRRPRLEGLDLEKAGLSLDGRGVPRFDPATMQCGDAPVFIAGDVDFERPFLHEASDEGTIAGRNAASFPEVTPHLRRTPLAIVFTDPQMAIVGRRFAELPTDDVEIGVVEYEDQGRARVMGRNAGLVRVYARREDGRLLGAEMLGPAVEHTSHLLAWAIQRGLTAEETYQLPFYHPVVEEGLRTALREVCSRLGILCESRPRDLEHGPGA